MSPPPANVTGRTETLRAVRYADGRESVALPRSVLASLRNLAHLAAELSHRSSRRIGRGSEVRRKRLAQCRSRSLEARAQPLDLSSTRPTDISRHEVQLACS